MITRASKLVAGVTAFPIQYNKAIVGKNAFAHEADIHQDGMLKSSQTYEIMSVSIPVSKFSLSLRVRSSAPSMALESAPAMQRWKRSPANMVNGDCHNASAGSP